MRNKKKGQSKARNSRHNKVVEAPSKETELPGKEVETPCKEAELPITDAILPSKEADFSSTEAELPSKEAELPSKEAELPIKEAESPIKKAELPSREVELPSEVAILPSKQAELPSKEVETPSEEEPSDNQKLTTMPSILEVSTPKVNTSLENFEVIKHPLENTWGFWLFTNEDKKNWTENQKKLTDFDTVEDYWCLYHYMKRPSELKLGQDYAVFKEGISPMWEDAANKIGGRWLINLERKGDMDRIWVDVVLLMIGECFKNSDDICGAVVNVRSRSRVSVWTRNKEESSNIEIGRKLKEVLRINFKIQFLDHKKNSNLYFA